MKLPFTKEQFFAMFETYNTLVFPAQIVFILAAAIGLYLIFKNSVWKNRFTGCILGFLWIWTGAVYHMALFREINPAALVFGAVFILQGILLFRVTFSKKTFDFETIPDLKGMIGYLLIFYGLIFYPAIGMFLNPGLKHLISLGLPCPTTILTFGFFMVSGKYFPRYLLIIPSLWALIGLSAALKLGVYQDVMILISALLANGFLLFKKRTM